MFIDLVSPLVSVLIKTGCNFPAYAFENQAETEGFGRMANRMGYEVKGLPNYVHPILGLINYRLYGTLIQRRKDTINIMHMHARGTSQGRIV